MSNVVGAMPNTWFDDEFEDELENFNATKAAKKIFSHPRFIRAIEEANEEWEEGQRKKIKGPSRVQTVRKKLVELLSAD